jgi:hypothetical protein
MLVYFTAPFNSNAIDTVSRATIDQ